MSKWTDEDEQENLDPGTIAHGAECVVGYVLACRLYRKNAVALTL